MNQSRFAVLLDNSRQSFSYRFEFHIGHVTCLKQRVASSLPIDKSELLINHMYLDKNAQNGEPVMLRSSVHERAIPLVVVHEVNLTGVPFLQLNCTD